MDKSIPTKTRDIRSTIVDMRQPSRVAAVRQEIGCHEAIDFAKENCDITIILSGAIHEATDSVGACFEFNGTRHEITSVFHGMIFTFAGAATKAELFGYCEICHGTQEPTMIIYPLIRNTHD